MENFKNFTRAGFFISRFYPKVRESRQSQNRDKTVLFKWIGWINFKYGNLAWVIPRLGNLTQAGVTYPGFCKDTREYLRHLRQKSAYVQTKN